MRRLLIRPGAIGDCILSFPALEFLKTGYTEVWISRPVVPLITFADAVVPLISTGIDLVGVGDIAVPEVLEKRVRSFDSIVSWYGANRPEFQEALRRIGPPCEFLRALPPNDYSGHACDFFARQVSAPTGSAPRILVEPRSFRRTAVIHPFSGSARKNWPLASFRELAAALPLPVEWTAGPEEDLPGAVRFANLADLARWIRGASIYIGNDSGITHLAAATGAPTLAILGPASPPMWEPRGERVSIVRCDSFESLRMESVLDEVNRLLCLRAL